MNKIFEYWKCVFKHPRAKFDEKRKKSILKAFKLGYCEDDILNAISGAAKTPWNVDNNYDDLSLILRDSSHIERFMSNDINPPQRKNKHGNDETHYERAQRETREYIRNAKRNGEIAEYIPGELQIPI